MEWNQLILKKISIILVCDHLVICSVYVIPSIPYRAVRLLSSALEIEAAACRCIGYLLCISKVLG